MKWFFVLSVLGFIVGMQACETEKNVAAVYINDCTGSYLRVEGQDYFICNFENYSGVLDGTKVIASFSFVAACNTPPVSASVCYLYHPFEDWIEVKNMYQ